ncbi:unnamed protein product [Trifolium pratense]|uniref:Uncharacterized protein n=1 Tax=Trifolium pratense TaxID=57577 RepID=A0ACB0LNB2_TRIPR|nr:unnamed protein product [Trifolium pratense]
MVVNFLAIQIMIVQRQSPLYILNAGFIFVDSIDRERNTIRMIDADKNQDWGKGYKRKWRKG